MNKLEIAAKSGDVKGFMKGMRFRELRANAATVEVLEETYRLFTTRPQPNLFGASNSEELAIAYREAVARLGCEGSAAIHKAIATPGVLALVHQARTRNGIRPDQAEGELLESIYDMRIVLRGGY